MKVIIIDNDNETIEYSEVSSIFDILDKSQYLYLQTVTHFEDINQVNYVDLNKDDIKTVLIVP